MAIGTGIRYAHSTVAQTGTIATMGELGRNGMEQMSRAFEISKRLYSGGLVSAKQIQNDFGVSKSTANRDMTQIEIAFPVVSIKIDGKTVFFLR
jgi:predicted DNA-binding transcriptional regulator YafY